MSAVSSKDQRWGELKMSFKAPIPPVPRSSFSENDEGPIDLRRAVYVGDLDQIKYFVEERKLDSNSRDEWGRKDAIGSCYTK